MRKYVIAFVIIYTAYIITSNAMPNFLDNLTQEQTEAYEACNRLRIKAPYLNLKCEKIKEPKNKNGETYETQNIKLLSSDDTITRKVNKYQEIKLRNLIAKLASERFLN